MIYLLAVSHRHARHYVESRRLHPREVWVVMHPTALAGRSIDFEGGDRVVQLERFWENPEADAIEAFLRVLKVRPDQIDLEPIYP